MALLDDLVAQVGDDSLRQHMASALRDLKRRQRFGLVFEEHIPETTALLGLPITVGSLVQRRSVVNAPALYRVAALTLDGPATIEPLDGGSTEQVPVADLMAVKRFGEPIYPSLTPLGSVQRGPVDRPHHVVINGENYHALQLLLFLFEGRFDCIYLDPPYNTGARDWKYNNRYVDESDAWRHSKWLSFMEKRLVLAKRLLKPDGVLIVTIDEHEVHHLGMLLERIFPEYLRHMVTVVINPKGTGKLNFARVDEYAIFCVPDAGQSIIAGVPNRVSTPAAVPTGNLFSAAGATLDPVLVPAGEADDDDEEDADDDVAPEDESVTEAEVAELAGEGEPSSIAPDDLPFPIDEIAEWEPRHARRRGGESSYRHQRPNQFYPIYIDPTARRVVRAGPSLALDQDPDFAPVDGLIPIWPIDLEGNHRCWRFISPKMQELIDARRVALGRYNTAHDSWTLNIWERRPESKKIKTVWWEKPHDAGTHGTSLLYKLLGRRNAFPFPKSVYAVRDALAAVVRNRPNALILDFFAGSGTTLHATCLLNAEDQGRRQTIMVTNNEVSERLARRLAAQGHYPGDPEFEQHGIFEQATRPRSEAVITGHRPNGAAIPGTHVGGRPFADGFDENISFFTLSYLDPDEVDLGHQFDAILPALWLGAGAVGSWQNGASCEDFSLPIGSPYGVLFRESRFRRFLEVVTARPDVTHVWLVTDSEESFAEMRAALPARLSITMLYRDYLWSFRSHPDGRG
jgi:adenine-specific DNA-methyltransferase